MPASYVPNNEFASLIKLLEEAECRRLINTFLKDKDLPFSAKNWEEFVEIRLKEYLSEGKITINELISILGEVEEHGKCHIFLYRCLPGRARTLIDEVIPRQCTSAGLDHLYDSPKVYDIPDQIRFSDIRTETDARGDSLILKFIEPRTIYKKAEVEERDDMLIRRYPRVLSRAVNVVRLWSFGLLEIRVQSLENSSKYEGEIQKVRRFIRPLLDLDEFRQYSLKNVKNLLISQRQRFSDTIRYNFCGSKDRSGNTMSVGTGREEDDFTTSQVLADSVNNFLESGAICNDANIYWKANNSGLPSRETHVLLSGLANEFALPARTSKLDYEFILDQVRILREEVSH